MDLQKLSGQFQTAVDAINNCRNRSRSDEEFNTETCVKDYAAKFSRLQELKDKWIKLNADDDFLESYSQEMDLLINRTR